jgi:hypothetical protein
MIFSIKCSSVLNSERARIGGETGLLIGSMECLLAGAAAFCCYVTAICRECRKCRLANHVLNKHVDMANSAL